jgi:hypothetical protein
MLQKVHLQVPFGADEELHRGIASAADLDLYMSFMERSPAHRYADTDEVRPAQPLLQHIYAIRTVPASFDRAWNILHGHRVDRALDFSEWSGTIMDAREVRFLFACLMDMSSGCFMSSLAAIRSHRGWRLDLGPHIDEILEMRPWSTWVPLLSIEAIKRGDVSSDDELVVVSAVADEGVAESTGEAKAMARWRSLLGRWANHRGTTAEAPPTASSQARVKNTVTFRIQKNKRKSIETIDKVIDKARKHRDTGILGYRDAVSFHQEVQKLL